LIRVIWPYAIKFIGILIQVKGVTCWLSEAFIRVGVHCGLGLAKFVNASLLFSIAKI